ncbi:hypothetical protein BsWGS_15351 [Bradybaena similaris]
MFDARNKGQPKLVYSRMPQNDAIETNQKTISAAANPQAPLPKSNNLQVPLAKANSSLGSSTKGEGQRPLSVFNDMQKDTVQSKSNQQSEQLQKQQQQHVEMRHKTQQHPVNVTVVDVVSTKKQQQTKGIQLYKAPLQDTGGKNTPIKSTKPDLLGELKVYKSNGYESGNEKRLVNEKLQTSSSSSIGSTDSEKMFIVSTVYAKPENVKHANTSDSSNANFLRHPRTHSDSSTNRSQISPSTPNQYPNPQQFIYYQQHQASKQQHEAHIDTPAHHQDRRPRPEVVRVRSYSAGRQPMPSTLHSTSHKPTNVGHTWSIPRVSTANRPHSLTVPPARYDSDGSRSPPAQPEFSSYNPQASPRALRSHLKPHQETTMRQLSASTGNSSLSSSSNPPKSILKPTANQEQPDVFFSSRPLLLPRAHSEKNHTYVPREFDFSSVLATNKDILSGKVPTIQITSQAPDYTTTGNSRPPLQRPLSVGAAFTNHDLKQEGRPIRKSVTFNNLVRLHHEDQASTVKSMPADA